MNFKKNLLATSIGLASAALAPAVANAVTISDVRNTSGTPISFTLDVTDFTVTNTGSIDLSGISFPSDILFISGSVTADINVQAGGSLLATPPGTTDSANVIRFNDSSQMTGNITNSGTITSDANAILFRDGSSLVGNIINNATGTITGDSDGLGNGSAIRIEQNILPGGPGTGGSPTGGLANRPVLQGSISNEGTIDSGSGPAILVYVGEITGSIDNGVGVGGTIDGIDISSSLVGGGILNDGTASSITGGIQIHEDTQTTVNHASIVAGGITNSGTIDGDFGPALSIYNNGQLQGGLTNNAGGMIQNSSGTVIELLSGGTITGGITNSGTINSSGSFGSAIRISGTGTSVTGGINNTTGGLISAAGFSSGAVIDINGGATVDNINNAGTISQVGTFTSAPAIRVSGGTVSGSITNSGSITSDREAIILDGNSVVGSIVNSTGGQISSSFDDAILVGTFFDPATLSNGISNDGTIESTGGNAIFVGGTISSGGISNTANGIIQSMGTTESGGAGILLENNSSVTGNITNSGLIASDTNGGIEVVGSSNLNGSIVNNAGASIETASDRAAAIFVFGGDSSEGSLSPSPVVSGSIQNTGTIQNLATMATSGPAAAIWLGMTDLGGSITNSGTIQSASGFGLYLQGYQADPQAPFTTALDATRVTGDITNSGTIQGAAIGALLNGSEVGGDIVNQSGGTIQGTLGGLVISSNQFLYNGSIQSMSTVATGLTNVAGDITNSGTIQATGATGTGLSLKDAVVGGSIANNATGQIEGPNGGLAIISSNVSGAVSNAGTINSDGPGVSDNLYGVDIQFSSIGGGFTNTGTITGGFILEQSTLSGALDNSGSIVAAMAGGDAVVIRGGSSSLTGISNSGTLSGEAGIVVEDDAIVPTITNSGTITGADAGIVVGSLSFPNTAVTSIVNNAGGTITGGSFGAILAVDGGTIGSVANAGTISGDIDFGGNGGTFTNTGGSAGDILNADSISISGGSVGDIALISGATFAITGGAAGAVSNLQSDLNNGGSIASVAFSAPGFSVTNTGTIGGNLTGIAAVTNSGNLGNVTLQAGGGTFNSTAGIVGNVSNVTGTASNAGTAGTVSFISGGGIFNNSGTVAGLNGSSIQITNSGTIGGNLVDVHSMTNSGTVGDVSFESGVQQTSNSSNNIGVFNAGTQGSFTNTGGSAGDITGASAVNITGGSVGDVELSPMGGTFTISGGSAGAVSNVTGTVLNDGAIGNIAFTGSGNSFFNSGSAGAVTGAEFVFNDGGTVGNVTLLANGIYGAVAGTSGTISNASSIDILTGQNTGEVVSTINGDLTFSGVLTMQAGGTTAGITNYSKLDVSGNANLNGASVFVLATGVENFQLNDSFTFLEAGGTLTSDITNFSACDIDSQDSACESPLTELTVGDSSQPLEFKVVQVGSTLQAVIGDIDFTPVIQPVDQGKTGTKNVTNLAGALNTIVLAGNNLSGTSLGNVTNGLAQVDVSTPEGQQRYARALSSLDPDTIEGASAGALSADAVAASTIDNRVSTLRSSQSGYYGFSGAVAGDPLAINGFWVQGYDNETEQDERDGTDGFDADTYGVAVGVDAPWGEDKIIGGAISYADTEVGMKQNTGNGMDITSLRLSLYGSYNTPNYYFDGQLAYAMNNYESTRVVDPLISGGSNLVATGDHDGDQYNVRVRAGYPMAFDSGWFITPKAELNYTFLSEDDFSEKGAGNAGLDISTDDMEVLVIGLGAKFAYPWTSENDVTWIPELSIDYMYDTIGDEVEVDSNFVGVTGAAFITEGANVEQEAIKLGLKLRVFSQGQFSFAGGYDYVTKQDYESHSLSATVRYDF